MQQHGDDGKDMVLSRREVVGGGSLLLGAFFLTGCGGGGASSAGRLPDTYWGSAPTISTASAAKPAVATPTNVPSPTSASASIPSGVMSRSQWTSKGVARQNDVNPLGSVKRITIHHDGMPPTNLNSMNAVRARLEQVRASHVNGRGWADIGYHYAIDPSGRVWEARSVRYQGAHVKDQNENNLGILVLGNFDQQSPTSSATTALDRFVASQMTRYGVPMSRVRTHQELAPTECPGRSLQRYMVRTRANGGQMASLASGSGLAMR